jgi:Fe-S cluster assembly protein SufD
MARGIPRAQAEALLIESFFGEALEKVAHEGLRAALVDRAAAWLALRTRPS